MVYVELREEEKVEVLLVAASLFLMALLASVCLATGACPLNRWLLERHLRKRRHLRHLGQRAQHLAQLGSKMSNGSFCGPPPGYEAALRAGRLQSLTSSSLASDKQLDLGDYFHQPKEEPAAAGEVRVRMDAGAPVMLRLWVRIMEPGELWARARGERAQLSRQLSIPQLLGSLVRRQAAPAEDAEPAAAPQQLSSLGSSASSSGSSALCEPPPDGAADAITSRVMHMNVASFSYLKDESIISSKKHSQLNEQQLCSQPTESLCSKPTGKQHKLCQLVVSICDIENVLTASGLSERSCAVLAASSAIYIQCELLLAKSKSARLLDCYPLRALHVAGPQATPTHTVTLEAEAAASALVPPAPAADRAHSAEAGGAPESARCAAKWRHEPSADGKSIVVFSSVCKQIAHQQQLAASCNSDLVQFDSVFASPAISKSIIEQAFIRFRVYSQCRYVNETCLFELKLPLKQLLDSETRDNLNDAKLAQPHHQHQADLIMGNLLTNLISGAATGEPAISELGAAEQARRLEQNQWRALMVSHWLNHLVAPSYECQLIEEPRGKIILGLSYLPTSNRVIFNAHRAIIDNHSYSQAKQAMKSLRLHSSTCYLLRLLMVANGRAIKRKQTPVSRLPEWDSQEPLTFDLASVQATQPAFVVALVMRNASMSAISLHSLRANQNQHQNGAQSEPETRHSRGAIYRAELAQQANSLKRQTSERDLVIGHLVIGDRIWQEMRAKPRKQIVRHFKMY